MSNTQQDADWRPSEEDLRALDEMAADVAEEYLRHALNTDDELLDAFRSADAAEDDELRLRVIDHLRGSLDLDALGLDASGFSPDSISRPVWRLLVEMDFVRRASASRRQDIWSARAQILSNGDHLLEATIAGRPFEAIVTAAEMRTGRLPKWWWEARRRIATRDRTASQRQRLCGGRIGGSAAPSVRRDNRRRAHGLKTVTRRRTPVCGAAGGDHLSPGDDDPPDRLRRSAYELTCSRRSLLAPGADGAALGGRRHGPARAPVRAGRHLQAVVA